MEAKQLLNGIETAVSEMREMQPAERREVYGRVKVGINHLDNIALRDDLSIHYIREKLRALDDACHMLAHPRSKNFKGDEEHVYDVLVALRALRSGLAFGRILAP